MEQRHIIRHPGDNCLCLKCDHSWFSKKLLITGIPPQTCARCHRYDWQEPRARARREKKAIRKTKGNRRR